MRNKILMTLALLLTAVTGAWAQTPSVKQFTVPAEWASDETALTAADFPADFKDYSTLTDDEAKAIPNPDPSYSNPIFLIYGFNETGAKYIAWLNGSTNVENFALLRVDLYAEKTKRNSKIYYTTASDEVKVTPVTGKTNEWTFTMPAFDVEIAPIYAPVAQWAKVDNVDQLPTAVEGIFAGTEDAIVNAGTVVEGQGTAMYFATTDAEMTAEKAAKAEGWLSTLPTAAGYDGAQTVYVWYYIKGADTPEGEKATAENTFNDSEICATPITVNVLSNKYDIQFKAANDNTIEAGKATVTVGGTAKTVTDGKLTGVKMNSKVTVKAKDGYKFRKVEVKKGGLLSIEIGGHATATIYYVEGETWEQAIQNHPEENSAWKIQNGYISGNGLNLFANYNSVNSTDTINPNANYLLLWT